MRVGPEICSSTGRAFAGLVLVAAIAGCGVSPASPSPSSSPTARHMSAPAPTPSPRATPTFVVTGNMNVPRMDATATLLANGKVLIAGGSTHGSMSLGRDALASAELYDPTSSEFTATGSMTTARAGATATLLRDGRVLIAGGIGCVKRPCSTENVYDPGGGDLTSAELYDPATGKFIPTGSMSNGRVGATATLLPDGRVYVAAGAKSLAAELYDPTTGRFTRAGSVLAYYGSVTSVLLPGGKVLLVGPAMGGPHAELDDPTTGRSARLSLELPSGVLASAQSIGVEEVPETATLLKDGRVLLCIFDQLVAYDPVTSSFTPSGSTALLAQWLEPATTLLSDGRVLFAGGQFRPDNQTDDATDFAGLYDPASGFRRIGSLITPRDYHTATLLPDGSVLIAGGSSDLETAIASADLLKP